MFVFSIDGPKQNATSLLTPVSNIVFYALSSGTLGFALHGSSLNHFLIGGNSSTANQILSCKWLLKLPSHFFKSRSDASSQNNHDAFFCSCAGVEVV